MKVVFLVTEVAPYRNYFFNRLSDVLEENFVVVATGSKKLNFADVRYKHKSSAHSVFDRRTNRAKNYTEDVRRAVPWFTVLELFRERPRLIISQNFGYRTISAWIYSFLFRVPLIIWAPLTEHSERYRRGIPLLVRKNLVRFSDGVIVNGKSGEQYIQRLSDRVKTIFKIPYSTENQLFSSCGIERIGAVRYDFLTIGQIIERKGILRQIALFQQYLNKRPQREIKWTLVGKGDLVERLSKETEHPRLHINIIPHVEYNSLPDLYAGHGIFLFPTLCDEWGVVVNEAMASGLPVLGSKYSGAIDELIKNGKSGWIYDPLGSYEEFEGILDEILSSNAEQLQKVALAAIERINEEDCLPVALRFKKIIEHFELK